MRLIDADALLKSGCEVCREEGRGDECAERCIFYGLMQNAPTIEPPVMECDYVENAVKICAILNADAAGKIWRENHGRDDG